MVTTDAAHTNKNRNISSKHAEHFSPKYLVHSSDIKTFNNSHVSSTDGWHTFNTYTHTTDNRQKHATIIHHKKHQHRQSQTKRIKNTWPSISAQNPPKPHKTLTLTHTQNAATIASFDRFKSNSKLKEGRAVLFRVCVRVCKGDRFDEQV